MDHEYISAPSPRPAEEVRFDEIPEGPRRHRVLTTLACAAAMFSTAIDIDVRTGGAYEAATPSTQLIHHESSVDSPAFEFLVLPGFITAPTGLSHNLKTVLGPHGNYSVMDYGSDYSVDAVYDRFIEQLKESDPKRTRDIVLYGHSMGGILGVLVAAKLEKNGYSVKGIVFDSSPCDADSVRPDDRLQAEALVALRDLNIPAGRAQRSIVEGTKKAIDNENFSSGLNAAEQTFSEFEPSKSWDVITSQARLIRESADLLPEATELLTDVPVLYIYPEENGADKLVNTPLAMSGWQALFSDNYTGYGIKNGKHTIGKATIPQYEEATLKFVRTKVQKPLPSSEHLLSSLQ